jgi:hypothetical protein
MLKRLFPVALFSITLLTTACGTKRNDAPVAPAPAPVVVTHPPITAEGGMWPLNMVSTEKIKREFYFDLTPEFLNKAQLSSLKVGGGASMSFVSSQGLALTNTHVVMHDVSAYDEKNHTDYFHEGYTAHKSEEEIRLPSVKAFQLVSIKDVTDEIKAAVKDGMSPEQADVAKKKAILALQNTAQATQKFEVVTYYHGIMYQLYTYKVYADVRLAFLPEADAAVFGDQEDNFNWYRHDFDVALVRVYENDAPVASVANHFSWSTAGPVNEELSIVVGHPGTTSRYLTAESLKFIQGYRNDTRMKVYSTTKNAYVKASDSDPEQKKNLQDDIFGIDNALLVWGGQQKNFADSDAISNREKQDDALVAFANSHDKATLADFKTEIAAIESARAAIYRESIYLDRGLSRLADQPDAFRGNSGAQLGIYGVARAIVRYVTQKALPEADRLIGYSNAELAEIAKTLTTPDDTDPNKALEKLVMTNAFTLAQQELGANHETLVKALLGQTPADFVNDGVDNTDLYDIAVRKVLLEGDEVKLAAYNDPFIQSALTMEAKAVSLRKQMVSLDARLNAAYAKRDQLVLDSSEQYTVFPDATSSLRIHFGVVRGYVENGVTYDSMTTVAGYFEKSEKANNQYPYTAAKKWVKAREEGRLDLNLPFNFTSTNDITGGNSGSPILNAKGEIIGVIFDGNRTSVTDEHFAPSGSSRAISVHSTAIREIMKSVYGATELADELGK